MTPDHLAHDLKLDIFAAVYADYERRMISAAEYLDMVEMDPSSLGIAANREEQDYVVECAEKIARQVGEAKSF